MRTLCIGDIHGCLTSLETLAASVPFQPDDQIVTLGDYVDRGPNSKGVLDWLIQFEEDGGKLHPLFGNHEIMMFQARNEQLEKSYWLAVGGSATLFSYTEEEGLPPIHIIPNEHWEFLSRCLPYFETETHIFVHASLDPKKPLKKQSEDNLFWERYDDPEPHCSGKHLICGHTPQPEFIPRSNGHATCIDTMAYEECGWLTAFDVATQQYWQANERGEVRQGAL